MFWLYCLRDVFFITIAFVYIFVDKSLSWLKSKVQRKKKNFCKIEASFEFANNTAMPLDGYSFIVNFFNSVYKNLNEKHKTNLQLTIDNFVINKNKLFVKHEFMLQNTQELDCVNSVYAILQLLSTFGVHKIHDLLNITDHDNIPDNCKFCKAEISYSFKN